MAKIRPTAKEIEAFLKKESLKKVTEEDKRPTGISSLEKAVLLEKQGGTQKSSIAPTATRF